MVCHEPALEGQ